MRILYRGSRYDAAAVTDTAYAGATALDSVITVNTPEAPREIDICTDEGFAVLSLSRSSSCRRTSS
jgi:hypothetical protein